jgi:hypothetical protein
MLCRICRGPRYGEQVHLPKSQETNLAIMLGDIEIVDAPVDPVVAATQSNPPFGWVIGNVGVYGQKVVLIRHDGCGGRQIYEDVPAPTRRWKYDPETGEEGYVTEPSDCPQSLVEEFLARKAAADVNPEADAERLRLAKYQVVSAQAKQNNAPRY